MKILSIGNSFSDDAHTFLYDLLASANIEDIVVANLYIGGCSLETHALNAKNDSKSYIYKKYTKDGYKEYYDFSLNMGICDETWDYITFQQASWASGLIETYKLNKSLIESSKDKYLDYIIDYVKTNLTKPCVFLWHKTWSYAKNCDIDGFKCYNYSQELMDIQIEKTYLDEIKNNTQILGTINSFEMIRELRKIFGDVLNADGYHLSHNLGRFIAAVAFFGKIFPSRIKDISFHPADVRENELVFIKSIAEQIYL